MSIPKEPRQLMINIMYLVLTALLALNVSAAIFNAFKIVDKGLVKSNMALDQQNQALPKQIKKSAKRDSKLQVYADRTDSVTAVSDAASKYFEDLIITMLDKNENGVEDDGDYIMKEIDGKMIRKDLIRKKDKDFTTRYLVNEGNGAKIKIYLEDLKSEFAYFVDEADRDSIESSLAIEIDDETWRLKKKKDWAEFNFKQMPVQATIPIFRKYINDIKSSEATVMNYLASKVGLVDDVKLDKFSVVAAPKKSYIIKGDPYEAEIFLTASAGGSSKTGISISVDGRTLPINADGKAVYKTTPGTTGPKSYNAKISVTNPVTQKTESYTEKFGYEVGERSVAVAATQMNVFYMGVPNPVEVTAAGVNSNEIKVTMGGDGGGSIKKDGKGGYIVTVTRPTGKNKFAKVNVNAAGLSASKDFRVKPIPDPVAKLSGTRGGNMNTGEFKAQQGVFAILENFDFDAKCNVSGYRVVRAARRADPVVSVNGGGRYTGETQRVISQATPGDKYYFENIKCKCPGDAGPRDLGSMSFTIK